MDRKIEEICNWLEEEEGIPREKAQYFISRVDVIAKDLGVKDPEEYERLAKVIFDTAVEMGYESAVLSFIKKLKKMPRDRRRRFIDNIDKSKPDRYLETRVENLLKRDARVFTGPLIRALVKYYSLPEPVARWKVKRVVARVRKRFKRFSTPENLLRLSEEYRIPFPYLKSLVDERIITPDTTKEELRTLGKVLRFLIKEGKVH